MEFRWISVNNPNNRPRFGIFKPKQPLYKLTFNMSSFEVRIFPEVFRFGSYFWYSVNEGNAKYEDIVEVSLVSSHVVKLYIKDHKYPIEILSRRANEIYDCFNLFLDQVKKPGNQPLNHNLKTK